MPRYFVFLPEVSGKNALKCLSTRSFGDYYQNFGSKIRYIWFLKLRVLQKFMKLLTKVQNENKNHAMSDGTYFDGSFSCYNFRFYKPYAYLYPHSSCQNVCFQFHLNKNQSFVDPFEFASMVMSQVILHRFDTPHFSSTFVGTVVKIFLLQLKH
jgi:hypothetical protein